MADDKKVMVFNAELQRETEHTINVDDSGEIILTCIETGRFLKFPAGTTAKQLKDGIKAHKVASEGQKSMAAIEAEKAKLIAGLTGGGD